MSGDWQSFVELDLEDQNDSLRTYQVAGTSVTDQTANVERLLCLEDDCLADPVLQHLLLGVVILLISRLSLDAAHHNSHQ